MLAALQCAAHSKAGKDDKQLSTKEKLLPVKTGVEQSCASYVHNQAGGA